MMTVRLLIAASLAVFAGAAQTQTYPTKVIKMVVPTGAGGPTDTLGRLIADAIGPALGQSVIIDNRAGAGGALGARAVTAAEPDGYTLLFGNTATLANIPAVSRTPGYDPAKDFAAVAKVMESFQIIVVRPDSPFKSVGDLVAYAKANPGKLNFGAAGAGNLTHLSGELLKLRAGMDFATVQFKSGAEFVAALLGGHVDFVIDNVAGLRSLIEDGRLRALAVTSAARQPDFPNLPTTIEAGVKDYIVTSFFGVVAPAATPAPIVDKLNGAINGALKSDTLVANLKKLSAVPKLETPAEFQAFIVQEIRRWTDISNATGIKVD